MAIAGSFGTAWETARTLQHFFSVLSSQPVARDECGGQSARSFQALAG